MITKRDVLLLLSDIEDKGVDTKEVVDKLVSSRNIPIEVLSFINDNTRMDIVGFYDKIRKSYNSKKSNLYINIVHSDEKETKDIVVTLSALLTQIFLYSKSVEDKEMFLNHSRANDITRVLTKYLNDYDITSCRKLLRLIKADIVAIETAARRREGVA